MTREQKIFVIGFALGTVTTVVGAWLLLKLVGV